MPQAPQIELLPLKAAGSPSKKAQESPTVDATSTRAQWVSSYGNKPPKKGASFSDHWLPVGPGYLDLDALESGYHAHLMIMHDSTSWLQSGMTAIKGFMRRFAQGYGTASQCLLEEAIRRGAVLPVHRLLFIEAI
ncbi:hypothetical protein QC762_0014400 [Podospora pseudocomata]|uniref:Uncharacterized protein n=1 Tax=Podospora pseudocomata TaxID=2093779 RepID=A0ABR0GWL6_9PEZI|nr:hypothetical protein QC762_0014400 [Podospora pseudocomata]